MTEHPGGDPSWRVCRAKPWPRDFERLERELDLQRQENKALAERLDRVTREGLTRFSVVIFLILAAGFAVVARVVTAPQVSQIVTNSVEAEQFTMRDKNGKKRAKMYVPSKGYPMLSFYDQNERTLLQVYTGEDSMGPFAGIEVFNTAGKRRLNIGGRTAGQMGLFVYDENGRGRADLFTDTAGTAGMMIYDEGGRRRIENDLRPGGSAGVTVYDRDGRKRTNLGVGTSNDWAGLEMFDRDRRKLVDHSLRSDGSPGIAVYNREGKSLFQVPQP